MMWSRRLRPRRQGQDRLLPKARNPTLAVRDRGLLHEDVRQALLALRSHTSEVAIKLEGDFHSNEVPNLAKRVDHRLAKHGLVIAAEPDAEARVDFIRRANVRPCDPVADVLPLLDQAHMTQSEVMRLIVVALWSGQEEPLNLHRRM